jgi:hypothetical protein
MCNVLFLFQNCSSIVIHLDKELKVCFFFSAVSPVIIHNCNELYIYDINVLFVREAFVLTFFLKA